MNQPSTPPRQPFNLETIAAGIHVYNIVFGVTSERELIEVCRRGPTVDELRYYAIQARAHVRLGRARWLALRARQARVRPRRHGARRAARRAVSRPGSLARATADPDPEPPGAPRAIGGAS